MAEEYEETETKTRLAKYHSSYFINQRLDELWRDVHRHRRQGKLILWNFDLDSIWSELAADIADGDKFDLKYKGFIKEMAQLDKASNGKKESDDKKTQDNLIYFTKKYNILLEKEIFLRRIQQKQGKGVKYEDDEDDYMNQ